MPTQRGSPCLHIEVGGTLPEQDFPSMLRLLKLLSPTIFLEAAETHLAGPQPLDLMFWGV